MSNIVKVSILIPMFNREDFLKECLDSVLNQTLKELEIIIIDDASEDKSFQLAQQYQEKDARIRLYKNEKNLGVAETRNKLFAFAEGEYIISLDPDDFYASNTILEKMYKEAKRE